MKWSLGPNSVLRESMFAGNQFFYSSKSNLISWVLFFSLLYWWRNWECVSHLPKDTQLRRCGTSPSLPGSPRSWLLSPRSCHHITFAHRDKSSSTIPLGGKAQRSKETGQIPHHLFGDKAGLISLCWPFVSPWQLFLLLCHWDRSERWVSMHKYGESGRFVLQFLNLDHKDYITFQNICSRGDGCEVFFFP